jgi:hypothetical protein
MTAARSNRRDLPMKIHYINDYNAKRGEIYSADNKCDDMFAIMHYHIRKIMLSLPLLAVESGRNAVN